MGDTLILNESEIKRSTRGDKRGSKVPKGLRGDRIKKPPLKTPISHIEDDYRAIKKAPKRKMSGTTLKYLKDKKIISGDQYTIYNLSNDLPEDRKIISELNTVEHINLKLLELYENT